MRDISHIKEYLTIGLSIGFGGGSLVAFMVFLYTRSLNIVNLDMDISAALWLDFSLCLLFFIQHSSMIRESFQHWVERLISPHHYGSLFAIFSGIALLLLVVFWQQSDKNVIAVEGVARILLRLIFVLSIIGLIWSARSLRSFDIIGKDQVLAHMQGRQLPEMPFTVRGPYRYIRHPFYFFMLLMIWSSPDLTLDRLLFNFSWTVWIVLGTILEERDLIGYFGDDYKEYKHNVPMLVPWRIFFRSQEK